MNEPVKLYPNQLNDLCRALGWQGGTYWQILDEVKRLRRTLDKVQRRDATEPFSYTIAKPWKEDPRRLNIYAYGGDVQQQGTMQQALWLLAYVKQRVPDEPWAIYRVDFTPVSGVQEAPAKLVNGQWEGVPLSQFPDLQEQVRKGLEDGTIQIGNTDPHVEWTPEDKKRLDEALAKRAATRGVNGLDGGEQHE